MALEWPKMIPNGKKWPKMAQYYPQMAQIWRPDLHTFSAIFFYWKSGSEIFFAFRMDACAEYQSLTTLNAKSTHLVSTFCCICSWTKQLLPSLHNWYQSASTNLSIRLQGNKLMNRAIFKSFSIVISQESPIAKSLNQFSFFSKLWGFHQFAYNLSI